MTLTMLTGPLNSKLTNLPTNQGHHQKEQTNQERQYTSNKPKKAKQLITKAYLFKYTENFTTRKWKFSDKNSDIFHISAQK